jgi:phosphohistidine phosphatase
MKTLLLLRHAKSSWKDASLGDHDRPLSRRGRRDAPRMGRLLREEGLRPDLVVSSTAKRARVTAALVAKHCGYKKAVEVHPELFHAEPDGIAEVLRELFDDVPTVMLVGHNPGLEGFVAQATGRDVKFPTAAVAQIAFPLASWDDFALPADGVLVNLWRPKDLDD